MTRLKRAPLPTTFPFSSFCPVSVFVVTFAVLSKGLTFDFISFWDDEAILQAAPIRSLTWSNLLWMLTTSEHTSYCMPLSWLNWAALFALGGLDASHYHFAALVYHSIAAGLLAGTLREFLPWVFTDQPSSDTAAGRAAFNAASCLGAIIWAVNPLRVEVALSIPVMPYSLAFVFLLLSFRGQLRRWRCGARTRNPRLHGALSLMFFGLALLAHPQAIAFIPVLLLPLAIKRVRAHSSFSIRTAGIVLRHFAPFIVLACGWSAVTVFNRVGNSYSPSLAQFTLVQRLFQACYVTMYYAVRSFYPFHLSPYYTRLLEVEARSFVFPLSAVACLGLTVFAVRIAGRRPVVSVGWLIHVLMTAPIWGIMHHPHYTNDRYGYIPRVLGAFIVASSVMWIQRRPVIERKFFLSFAGLNLILLALMSFHQADVWRNACTLYDHVLSEFDRPGQVELVNYTRAARANLEAGNFSRAADRARTVLKASPDDHQALNILVLASSRLRLYSDARAALGRMQGPNARSPEEQLLFVEAMLEVGSDSSGDLYRASQSAIASNPHDARAHLLHARVCGLIGRADEAFRETETALQINPVLIPARIELAGLLVEGGRLTRADEELAWCLEHAPRSLDVLCLQARLAAVRGQPREAVALCHQALRRDETDARIMASLGSAHLDLGDLDRAAQWLEASVAGDPAAFHGDPARVRALNDLGFIHSTSSRPNQAARYYRMSLEIAPAQKDAHLNLALALIETRDMDGAKAHLQKVLEMDPADSEAMELLARLVRLSP